MAFVVPYKESIQYDGTNGSFIIDTWLGGAVTLVSDTGTTLTWENIEHDVKAVPLDGWLVKVQAADQNPANYTDSDYMSQLVEVPEPPELVLAAGYALTPTILTTASADVAVDLDAAMTGTGYEFTAVLAGSASLLGGLEITGAVATDSDTVTVTVHNTGLVSLAGATVIVAAAQLVYA